MKKLEILGELPKCDTQSHKMSFWKMPVFIQTVLDAKNNFRFLSDLLFQGENVLKNLQANVATNQRGQPG